MQFTLNGDGKEVAKSYFLERVVVTKNIWNSFICEMCILYPYLFISFNHLFVLISIQYLFNIGAISQYYIMVSALATWSFPLF